MISDASALELVIGLDPGPETSAWVVWDGRQILSHGIDANLEIDSWPTYVNAPLAIEWMQSYGMPVGREVFDTCLWVGRLVERCKCSRRVKLITRHEVKCELCHSARATDANVRQVLLDLVGKPGTKRAPGPTYGIRTHEWAALAVAVVAHRGELIHVDGDKEYRVRWGS